MVPYYPYALSSRYSNGTDGNSNLGCSNPESHAFWDGIHPTEAAHAFNGQFVLAAVIPIPAALPLMVSALCVMFGWRRIAAT